MSEDNSAIAKFIASQSRARELIHMDVNGNLDKIKNKAVSENKLSYNDNGEVNVNLKQESKLPNGISAAQKAKSRLPKEILESMNINPIEEPTSIIDSIEKHIGRPLVDEMKSIDKKNDYTPSGNSQVDYSMIKMIVEDCLKRYTTSIKKTILSESKNSSSNQQIKALKLGDKFTFITDDGDLYEAKMTFIKNIKSIKKGGN